MDSGAEPLMTWLRKPGPWKMTFSMALANVCRNFTVSFVEIDKERVDAWGVPVPKIHCIWQITRKALLY